MFYYFKPEKSYYFLKTCRILNSFVQDKGAKDWLGSYLARYSGTLLVVSHDEPLLKAAGKYFYMA